MLDSISIGNIKLPTVIAITEEEQAEGLMFKTQLPPAIAFPFNDSKIKSFWMKNTFCPLDIVFCNNDKVIKIAKGIPLSEKHIYSGNPSNLVIELPEGDATRLNVTVGTPVKLNYSIISLAKLFENKLS